MMDLVAWHVDPCSHQAGFTPHRDRHLGLEEQDLGEVQAGFRQEHGCSPRDSTCWIALADAAPDNGQCSHLSTYMPPTTSPAVVAITYSGAECCFIDGRLCASQAACILYRKGQTRGMHVVTTAPHTAV